MVAAAIASLALHPAGRAPFARDAIRLPDIGDSSGRVITPTQEKELGEAFFRSLHQQLRINEDPEIQQFIQSLGGRLAAQSDNTWC